MIVVYWFVFFKQKTACEMRISDWSSDVCSSGLELDLDLHVACDGQQGRAHLLHQHLARLGEAVDVGVVAVADVGQLLGQRIVVVAAAEAERGQGDAGLALVGDQRLQCALVEDRKSVVSGKSVSVRVDLGGRRIIKKKKVRE